MVAGTSVTQTFATPTQSAAVGLKEVKPADFEKEVAAHAGKVVVVDVWFLGCVPCVKKFHETVELHDKYADKGVVVMSLDVMESELPNRAKVFKFLTDKKAAFPNYIFNGTEADRDAWMDRNEAVPTPALLLYNRKGERVKTLTGATPPQVEAEVKALLAAK